jgi:hypothetical protein
MYKLEFGSGSDTMRVYMFETSGDGFATSPVVWTDITGQSDAVFIRFDPVDKDGIFTPIIKTSLQLGFVRENDDDFLDIIEAEDGTWMAVVLKNGELDLNGSDEIIITGASAELLFKGTLTNETYGETYLPFARVDLTFHDRIGDLNDKAYIPTNPTQRIVNVFAFALNGLPNDYNFRIEFPFDIQETDYKNLQTPRDIYLDVSEYVSGTCKDVIVDILESFKLQMVTDFTVIGDTLSHSGATRVRFAGYHSEETNVYYDFIQDDTGTEAMEYAADSPATSYESDTQISVPTSAYEIIERSCNWQLTRKAKYVKGTNNFGTKDNVLHPETLNRNQFDYKSGTYSMEHSIWRTIDSGVDSIAYIDGDWDATDKAVGNMVGTVPGLVIDTGDYVYLLSTRVPVIKSGSTFSLTVTGVSTQTAKDLIIELYAYDGTRYGYDTVTDAWPVGGGTPLSATFASANVVETFTFDGLAHSSLVGNQYFLTVRLKMDSMAAGNTTYITECKLHLNYEASYPSLPGSIAVTTAITATRRKSVEFESQFYCNPLTSDQGINIFDSLIMATGLDIYDEGILVTPNSTDLHPVQTFEYEGESGTLLVHSTDIVGVNYLINRWKFWADIKGTTSAPTYDDPYLLTTSASAITSTSFDTGGYSISRWAEITTHGMEYKKPADASWTSVQTGTTLSANLFTETLDTLDTDIYLYRAWVAIDANKYYGNIKSVTMVADVEIFWDSVVDTTTDYGVLGENNMAGQTLTITLNYSITSLAETIISQNSASCTTYLRYSVDGGANWVDVAEVTASIPGAEVGELDTQTVTGRKEVTGITTVSNFFIVVDTDATGGSEPNTVGSGWAYIEQATLSSGNCEIICDDQFDEINGVGSLSCTFT